jgi:hypothetical protein
MRIMPPSVGATVVAQAAGKTKGYGQYRVAVTEEVAIAA